MLAACVDSAVARESPRSRRAMLLRSDAPPRTSPSAPASWSTVATTMEPAVGLDF